MPTGLWLYAYVAFCGLLLVDSLLMIAVIRQIASLHGHYLKNDLDAGPPLGAPAPALSGEDVFGRPVSLAVARGKKTLLCFLSTGCSSCKMVMSLAHTLSELEGLELVLAVSAGRLKTELYLAEQWPRRPRPDFPVLADENHKIADRYKAVLVPYLVVVDEDGRIGAKGTAATLTEVGMFVHQADELRDRRMRPGEDGERPFAATALAAASEPVSARK